MTIRLNWPSQSAKGLTAIEIYRKVGWNATLDVNNPGTPIATLAGDATEFVEDVANLTNKTTYRYWVAAVKGTERLIGNPITQGFFLDTGPGPQTLKKGDWGCGYFGSLTKDEFFNTPELKLLLPAAQASLLNNDPPLWHKFIFRGRVVFYPSAAHSSSYAVSLAYTRGMMYGTDDNGLIVPTGQTATKQDCKVTKDGRTYRIRFPWALPYDTAAGGSDWNNGEWRNTFARLFTQGNNNQALIGLGPIDNLAALGSNSAISDPGAAAMAPLESTTSNRYAYGYSPMSLSINNSLGAAHTMFFVFELILP
ncbi:putative virion structural protein [Erwinia phage vB_EamM_Caitlin]|uniref:putative virion structural protein n=1 Tax=Erwinia phage vB_EamM_Caitlin TaxID=1883379 RepID=UPI00081CCB90|nr:putative virion structural protein [Erwinia phage vB_EamM_Caitlin]ANZ48451.1 putative virion structural protein [Erwinia phage vB_EamM_Caitlin]